MADFPELCRFQVPGRYKEGPLQVAISTRGGSPALSRRLREKFTDLLSPWAPLLVEWLAGLRSELKKHKPDDADWRGTFLNRLVDSHFETLKEFGVGFTGRVLSAHRTPEDVVRFVGEAEAEGVRPDEIVSRIVSEIPEVAEAVKK